jgi:hypothetical protein
MERARSLLKELRNMLAAGGEDRYLSEVDAALAGDENVLWSFLTSNELWGGAGSIADEALGPGRESRRPLEQLLAQLGRTQLAMGRTNPRTESWTLAFEQWHSQNI